VPSPMGHGFNELPCLSLLGLVARQAYLGMDLETLLTYQLWIWLCAKPNWV